MLVPTNLKVDRMEEQRTYFIDIAVSFAINCLHNFSSLQLQSYLWPPGAGWGGVERVMRQNK